MSELELKNGQSFIYMDQYETVEVKVSYAKTIEGHSAFKIRVNSKPVIISKNFKSIVDKLNEIDWETSINKIKVQLMGFINFQLCHNLWHRIYYLEESLNKGLIKFGILCIVLPLLPL